MSQKKSIINHEVLNHEISNYEFLQQKYKESSEDKEICKKRLEKVLRLFLKKSFSKKKLSSQSKFPTHPLKEEFIPDILGEKDFKHWKSSFKKFINWLGSKQNIENENWKEYTFPLDPNDYPEFYKIFETARYFLQLPETEGLLTKNPQITIKAYFGNPGFLLIRDSFFSNNKKYILHASEFSFLVASELTYLHYGHHLLTSEEIWKGCLEKGTQTLELFAIFLGPLSTLGTLGKSSSTLYQMKQLGEYSNFTKSLLQMFKQHRQKLSKYSTKIETAKHILKKLEHVPTKFSNLKNLFSFSKKATKKDQLVMYSRMMQCLADRIGLLFCQDITASIRAILLTSNHPEIIEKIETDGLEELVFKKDSQGHFIYESIAIRVISLISFYISKSYETAQKNFF